MRSLQLRGWSSCIRSEGTMATRLNLIVFDLAGTTVVDDDHVLRSFLQAAAAFDLSVAPEQLQNS